MQEIEEEGQDEIEEEAQDDRQPTSGDGGDKEEKEKQDRADRLKRNVSELTRQKEDRLQTLETSIFQLANYYFVFQGVVFSAVFDSSHVKCVHRTVAVILSLTAAVLNLTALIFIARRHRDWSSDLDEASELRGELFGTKTPKSSTSELGGIGRHQDTKIFHVRTEGGIGQHGDTKIFHVRTEGGIGQHGNTKIFHVRTEGEIGQHGDTKIPV